MTSLEITTRIGCKNGCAYCPQELLAAAYGGRSREYLMTLETFREFLEKIPADVDIHFSGMCEPWLNPGCTEMVRLAHHAGHRLRIFTSLAGMTATDVDALAGLAFDAFVVHLPSSEGYEKIAIDDGYLTTLRRLQSTGLVTSWICHSTRVHPLIRPVVCGKIGYFPLITRAGNVQIEGKRMPGKRTGPIRCERNLRQNVLLPSGEILLCCMDYGMKHIIGNLREHDYPSLFTGEEFLRVQRGLKDSSLDILCRTCDYFVRDIGIFAKLRNFFHSTVGGRKR